LKGISYYGNKKTILYASNIDEATKYSNIIDWMKKLLNLELETNIINYKTSKIYRIQYIKQFGTSNINQILINVQILNEGIDIPECDSVFITKPSENIINLIQRMCRCNRILLNKKICNIYFYCSKNNRALNYIDDYFKGDIIYDYLKINNVNRTNGDIIDNHNDINNNNIINNVHINIDDYIDNEININPIEIEIEMKKYIKYLYDSAKYHEFLIDSEIIRNFLQINNKRIFDKTIMRSYKINIDYTMEKAKKSVGSGGHNLKVYTLTPNAVKKIFASTSCKNKNEISDLISKLDYIYLNH
jgi:superfamily II DNA/RNA helicase